MKPTKVEHPYKMILKELEHYWMGLSNSMSYLWIPFKLITWKYALYLFFKFLKGLFTCFYNHRPLRFGRVSRAFWVANLRCLVVAGGRQFGQLLDLSPGV